jgi:phosphohistidine phosphatase
MTAEALSEELTFQGSIQWAEQGYLGDAEAWLGLLHEVPPELDHVAVVGHNPGMAELVAGLTTGTPFRLNLHFPPAAVAHLEMELFWWNQIRWGCGQLKFLFTPKLFR